MTNESQQPSTLHYQQDYQCCKCDTYFMPYQDPISICPECGETVCIDHWAADEMMCSGCVDRGGRITVSVYQEAHT